MAADLLLEPLGVVPAVDWLRDSGSPRGDGILCDVSGRTAAPHVWAVGEVASWGGTRVERSARTAACCVLCRGVEFRREA